MPRLFKFLASALLLSASPSLLRAQGNTQRYQGLGQLEGSVTDGASGELLIGAVVKIESINRAALTNEEGRYRMDAIPQGTYVVKASYLGYRQSVQFEIRVESGTRNLDFQLQSADTLQSEVQIEGTAFDKTVNNIVSVRTIGTEQILSNPGGNNDISKVIQSLPGVAGSVPFRNDIIIRGGAPNENVFYLDGIEVPNINHFATQGSGGGPQGIINANFIQRVNFSSTGFDAKYDNALSSVFEFEFQEGNREKFQTTLQLSATDAGVTFDTPLNKKRTASALVSVRRSYLDGLFSVIGLPFLPEYWDTQFKIKWDINQKTSLTFIHLGAIDRLRLNNSSNLDSTQLNIQYGIPIISQNTYTFGVVLKRITKRGFFTVAISRNWLQNLATRDPYDSTGKRYSDPANRPIDLYSEEAENKIRVNFVTILGKWRLTYGGMAQLAQYYTKSQIIFNVRNPLTDSVEQATVRGSTNLFIGRFGFFAGVARAFLKDRLKFNVGLRFDMNTFTTRGWNPLESLSPRASLSYAILPKLSINASTGVYYKTPFYTVLGYRDESKGGYQNRNNRYIMNYHAVLGLEYVINSSMIVSVEGFFKYYDRYPVSLRNYASLANFGGSFGVYGNEPTVSEGQGRAYGFEVFFQKRLTERFYGTISYTFYYSEFTGIDPTTLKNNGKFVRSAWDNRNLLTLTGGVLLGKKKTWELAAKWRLVDGVPYTPYDVQASVAEYQLNGDKVLDYKQLNAKLTTIYSQFDIRVDKKFFFKKWSLNIYLDIQNLFQPLANALNINSAPPDFALARQKNDVNSFVDPAVPLVLNSRQGVITPSLGIRIKFGVPLEKKPVMNDAGGQPEQLDAKPKRKSKKTETAPVN
jgi:hypothetical protein